MVDLVEFIQHKGNFQMMADVKGKVSPSQLQIWYSELNAEEYSLDRWNDAISYILSDTSKNPAFKNMNELRKWLYGEAYVVTPEDQQNHDSIEEIFKSEIYLCKNFTKEPEARKECIDYLRRGKNIIPDKYVKFEYPMVAVVFEGKEHRLDSRQAVASRLGFIIARDVFEEASKKNAGCIQIRELVDVIVAVLDKNE